MKKYVIAAVVGFVVAATGQVISQKAERDTPATKQWSMELDRPGSRLGSFRLHFVDTAGVCIYIVRDSLEDVDNSVSVTAVSKKDLPTGMGCQ